MSVELHCVKEGRGSKIRVRIAAYINEEGKRFGQVYNNEWNCQFPRNLRQEGKCFIVSERNVKLQTTRTGIHFYTVSAKFLREVHASAIMPEHVYEISTECVVCMDSVSNLIYFPCGHLCSCEECGNQLEKCPICRKVIASRIIK